MDIQSPGWSDFLVQKARRLTIIEAIPDGSRFIYKTTSKGRELREKLGQFKNMMDHLYSNV